MSNPETNGLPGDAIQSDIPIVQSVASIPSILSQTNHPKWLIPILTVLVIAAIFAGQAGVEGILAGVALLLIFGLQKRYAFLLSLPVSWLLAASWLAVSLTAWRGMERDSQLLGPGLWAVVLVIAFAVLFFRYFGYRSQVNLFGGVFAAVTLGIMGLTGSILLAPLWITSGRLGEAKAILDQSRGLSDALFLFALLGVTPFFIYLKSNKQERDCRFPFVAGAIALVVSGGIQAAQVYADWYKASDAERTPGQAIMAFEGYEKTLGRLERIRAAAPGSNLNALLHRRMAVTALDGGHGAGALIAYPPRQYGGNATWELAASTWTSASLTQLRNDPITGFSQLPGLYVDFEIRKENDNYQRFALDAWGRVWRLPETEWGIVRLEWSPNPLFPGNAEDLESRGDVWIVLGGDGRIDSSVPIPWLKIPESARISPEHKTIALKILPNADAALITTNHGHIVGLGNVPANLKIPERPLFSRKIVADLEIDYDGGAFYLLDKHGAIHAFPRGEEDIAHSQPEVPSAPYWRDMAALDLERAPPGKGFYISTVHGEVFPVVAEPYRMVYRPEPAHRFAAVGLAITDEDQPLVLLANGSIEIVP